MPNVNKVIKEINLNFVKNLYFKIWHNLTKTNKWQLCKNLLSRFDKSNYGIDKDRSVIKDPINVNFRNTNGEEDRFNEFATPMTIVNTFANERNLAEELAEAENFQ